LSSLAQALLQLGKRLHRPGEEQQVRRLLAEIVDAQPDAFDRSWWKWLLSVGLSLDLNLHVTDMPAQDVPAVLATGAHVVITRDAALAVGVKDVGHESEPLVVLGPAQAKSCRPTAPRQPVRLIIAVSEPDLKTEHQDHVKPWVMLWRLLAPDRKDLWALVAISGVAGLLMLSIPVTAQQLVRTVTFATLYQPIVVLSLMLLGLLGFVAALQALQVYVAEIIQRRLFVRIASQVTRHLARADLDAWRQIAMPELVNRFLEIAIVQKVVASILVDGVAIVLTTLIGMSVMAFYHPFLLGYDVLLIMLLALIVFGFGRGGVRTSIRESRAKYNLQAWLEDLARCPTIFRTGGAELLPLQRTEVLCAEYLRARRAHFHILMRQIIMVLVLQAVATTSLLGLGGFLVLQEQLTLGQLVAAELIVAMIVASFAKLGKHLENWYDLLASVDKLAHLLDLPEEERRGLLAVPRNGPAEIEIHGFASDADEASPSASEPAAARVAAGEAAALLNWDPACVADLGAALLGARPAGPLTVALDGVRTDDIRPDVLREHAVVVRDLEFLEATIAENVHLSRAHVSDADVREACRLTGLTDELQQSGLAMSTPILPSGWPLDPLQSRRMILARALAGRPRAILIDHLFDAFGEADFRALWANLSPLREQTTFLVATVRQEFAHQIGRSIDGSRGDH
jgi:ABC-type bacteriocin/lantibiotic exporter with double-glycine peptidase domain